MKSAYNKKIRQEQFLKFFKMQNCKERGQIIIPETYIRMLVIVSIQHKTGFWNF